jgi:serine/threonine protein kinase
LSANFRDLYDTNEINQNIQYSFRTKTAVSKKEVLVTRFNGTFNKVTSSGRSPYLLKHMCLYRKLKHENIVQLLMYIVSDSLYLVFIPSLTLAQLYEQFIENPTNVSENPLFLQMTNENWVRNIMVQIVSVVGYLHSNGIVNGMLDLKSFLIDDNGQIYLWNFGHCGLVGEEIKQSRFCFSTAPEIAHGWSRNWEFSSDIWGIGMIFSHLLKPNWKTSEFKGANFELPFSQILHLNF